MAITVDSGVAFGTIKCDKSGIGFFRKRFYIPHFELFVTTISKCVEQTFWSLGDETITFENGDVWTKNNYDIRASSRHRPPLLLQVPLENNMSFVEPTVSSSLTDMKIDFIKMQKPDHWLNRTH